jgi:glycosyltransferase involved in cell wall biosynthesis
LAWADVQADGRLEPAVSKYVVMMGTDPAGQGGIASVVSIYLAEGLTHQFNVRYCVSHRNQAGLAKFWLGLRAGVQLLVWLLGGRVALLHVHTASGMSFARKSIYLAMARGLGVPTVFHLHGGGFQRFVAELRFGWMKRWAQHTLKSSTQVFTLSASWRSYVQELAPGTCATVIVNPVRLPQKPSSCNEEQHRVLFLGRANQAKGAFDLVAAVGRLRAAYPGMRLAIAGDADAAALQRQIEQCGAQGCVEVLGWLGTDERAMQLQRAQIFALPSYHEGLPMAMLEAMVYGKAVVVTPVGGIPDAVEHEANGLLVQPGDIDALAAALARLFSDQPLRRKLAQAAQERAEQHYGADGVLQRVAQCYDSLGVQRRAVS